MGFSGAAAAGEGAKAAGEAGAGAATAGGLGAAGATAGGLSTGALAGITSGVLADGGATLGGLSGIAGLGAGGAVGAGALGASSLASIGAGLGAGIAGGDALGDFAGGSLLSSGGGLPSAGGDVFLNADGSLSAAPGSPTAAASGTSPTSALANTSANGLGTTGTPTGSIGGAAPSSVTGPTGGAQFTDATQGAAQFSDAPQAAPLGANPGAAGAAGDQGSLSSLYGPNSTAIQSPMGQAISGSTGGDVGGATMGQVIPNMGTLGQGSPSFLSSMFGDASGNITPGSVAQKEAPNLISSLANEGLGAYQQYAKNQAAKNYANQISQLYSPTGAYAQQMQQTLARQDAAAGRNSQSGTRAVQLAAALTQGQAQALGGNNYSQASQNVARTDALNGLFTPTIMNAAGTAGTSAYTGLAGLFSSPSYSY